MVYIPKSQRVARNLKRARVVENHKIFSVDEELKMYREGLSFGERLKLLLSPLLPVKKEKKKKSLRRNSTDSREKKLLTRRKTRKKV